MLNATWKYGRAEKKCILNASTSGLVLDDDDVNICSGLFGMHSPQSHIVCCCISCSCTQNARKIEFFRNASSMPVAAAEPSQMPFKYGSLHNCTQYRLRVLCSTQSTHTKTKKKSETIGMEIKEVVRRLQDAFGIFGWNESTQRWPKSRIQILQIHIQLLRNAPWDRWIIRLFSFAHCHLQALLQQSHISQRQMHSRPL